MLLFALAGSVTSLAQALEQCCKSGRLSFVPVVLLQGVNSDFTNAFQAVLASNTTLLHLHGKHPCMYKANIHASTYAFET